MKNDDDEDTKKRMNI